MRVLDIGASSGTFVCSWLDSKGWNASGVEPSIAGVDAAHKHNVYLDHATAEALPYRDEPFDIVHSHHVFEHLADPLVAAQEAGASLGPVASYL